MPSGYNLPANSEGYYQVLNGLSEGADIVTSAQFMIDSESNLKAAVSQYTADSNEGSVQEKSAEESIIREGTIDLISIDKNKDGKVFQDTMDWNVISDEAGDCPLCGMKLKEVTLEKAKENLIKNGFKIKEK